MAQVVVVRLLGEVAVHQRMLLVRKERRLEGLPDPMTAPLAVRASLRRECFTLPAEAVGVGPALLVLAGMVAKQEGQELAAVAALGITQV